MKFRFIGDEPSDFMGFNWFPGTEHDVTDEHAVRKLTNSVLFETMGETEPVKNKGGRPKRVTIPEGEPDVDDAN